MKDKTVAIIDYGLGNLRSVAGAIKKLDHEPVISSRIQDLEAADKLILPGVGAFGDGMANLRRLGLIEPLNHLVVTQQKPILGICLGAQLMAQESCEFGAHTGLGWLKGKVVKIETKEKQLRIPHVGWNDLIQTRDDILFEGIPKDALFYYVHSFYIQCADSGVVIGECEYGVRFTAAIHQDNIYATQFHPEKSQSHGLSLLKNFLTKA